MTTPPALDRPARIAVTAVFVGNGALIATWLVRIPDVRSELGLTEAVLGLVLLGLSIGTVVSLPLSGSASARFGSRPIAVVGTFVGAAALAAVPWVPGPLLLALTLVVLGAGSSMTDVGMNAQAAGVEVGYRRSIMVGFHAAWSFGGVLAAGIGAAALALRVPAAWHLGVMAVAVLAVTVAAAPWLRIRDRARRTAADPGSRLALPHGPLVAIALIALGATIGENVAGDWAGIVLADLVGVGPERVAWGFVVFSGTMMLARLVGDRVADRFGGPRTIALGGTMTAGGFLVIAAAPWLPTGTLAVTLAGFAAIGTGVAVIVPLAFTLGARLGRTSGEGIAAVATVGYGGFLLAPPVVGFVAEYLDLRVSLVLVAIAVLTLTARAPRHTPSHDPPHPENLG